MRKEESGEACGSRIGERAGEEKEACGEIYEEDDVRSSPLLVRMKQKACVKIRLENEKSKEGE